LGIAGSTAQLVGGGPVNMLVELLLKEVNDLTGVESQVTGIGGKHPLGVATLRDILEVTFLEGNEDLLLEFQNLRGLAHRET
jgi:hypothetical protein